MKFRTKLGRWQACFPSSRNARPSPGSTIQSADGVRRGAAAHRPAGAVGESSTTLRTGGGVGSVGSPKATFRPGKVAVFRCYSRRTKLVLDLQCHRHSTLLMIRPLLGRQVRPRPRMARKTLSALPPQYRGSAAGTAGIESIHRPNWPAKFSATTESSKNVFAQKAFNREKAIAAKSDRPFIIHGRSYIVVTGCLVMFCTVG